MSESNVTLDVAEAAEKAPTDKGMPSGKPSWETPKLEDVSEQVMAQPYIRFT